MEAKQSNLRDFDVQNKLGEGAFGQVFKVIRKADGKEYALKKVKIGAMKEKERDNALNEIRILASYNEEYIIGYKEAFYDEPSATLCVVMEFASGGDILKRNQSHLKSRTKYKEEEIWMAMVHMLKGLKSLHDKKILHRDLKCANVFITADNIYKLGDLNVSKVLKKDMAQTQTGTPYYASPQVWKDKPYGAKSDIWSLGCVLYEMASLRPPFTATDLQGLYKKVCAGVFERIPLSYTNDLSNIIGSMLKVDPERRSSTDQLLSNPLIHKYFKGEIGQEPKQDQTDQLLKTIKYNPKDLKGLKNMLPKANYEEEISQKQKLNLEDFKGGLQSCKNNRKQPISIKEEIKNSVNNNDRKLEEFLEKRKMIEEKERLRQMKIMMDQKEELSKRRERVLSACGVRQPTIACQSPRIALIKKSQDALTQNKIVNKKEDPKANLPPKMPPKPQGNNLNYKLPPKPVQGVEFSNKSLQKSQQKKDTASMKKIEKVERPASSRIARSSSAQKIIYPSWWG